MLNILAKSALESAVVLDTSLVRTGEHLLFHPFVRKPVAFTALTGDQAQALSALGWGKDTVHLPERLDTLAMLQSVWPNLRDVRPETIAPVLNEQGIELALKALPVHLRRRGMAWTKSRCKALGLHSLVGFIERGMPDLVMESDHPLAPTSNEPTVFLRGADPSKAFLITGDERSGYRLHTFSAGENVVQSRHADTMEDLFRPESEWGVEDWASLDALLTASQVEPDNFWNAPALADYPNTRNSLLDMLDERYWQAQVKQDGVGALVGVAHDLFQRRFRDSVTTPWLVNVGEQYGLRFDTPAEFRMMTDAWAIAELDDQTVISEVLPMIREEHDSTLAHWPDDRLLALWRSGFEAVIQNVQRMQETGVGQGIIRNGAIVSDVTPSEIRETLHQHYTPGVINSLEDAGKIEFIASPHDLPERLKSNYSVADLEGIAGLEHNGKVYLCADRISRDQIVGLFLHEVGEHAALNRMLGPDYGRLVTQFERLLQSGDPYARRSAARVPRSTPAYQIPSERLAYLVENVANEQASMKGGEGGYALGQECLANLRAWIFRSPTSRYLDKVGQLGDFQLNSQDIAALAREAVDYYARQFSPELRDQPINNSWAEALDQEVLDQLYMATSEVRKELLGAMSTEQALGYIYALQALNAPAIGASVDEWLAITAETAVTGPDTLRVLAGQVIANHSKIQTRDRLSQQIGRQGFAIWQDDTSSSDDQSPRHLHLVTRSQKFEGFWQLTSYDPVNGPLGDTQHKHWEDALAAVSTTAHFIPDEEALAALQYFSGHAPSSASPAQQPSTGQTELHLFHVSPQSFVQLPASDSGELLFNTVKPDDSGKLANEGANRFLYEVTATIDQALLIQSDRMMLDQAGVMDALREHAPELAAKASTLNGEAFFREVVSIYGGIAQASAILDGIGIPGIARQAPTGFATDRDPATDSDAQLNDAAFAEWFGSSQVVDADGQPLVVYHGTTADIDEFTPQLGHATEQGVTFFTSSPELASDYALGGMDRDVAAAQTKLLERMRQPDYDMFSDEAVSLEAAQAKALAALEAVGQPAGANVIPVFLSMRNPLVVASDTMTYSQQRELFDRAAAAGHDGVIIRGTKDGASERTKGITSDVYVVFNSSQIRSVTSPYFAPEKPRLSFAGPLAVGHDAEALLLAREMEQAGEDAELIRQQTAWFKGVDGKWRYEIDDSRAFIKGTGLFKEVYARRKLARVAVGELDVDDRLRVSDLMYHPTLFAAYPAVARLEVRLLVSPPDEKGKTILGALADDGVSQWVEINTLLSSTRAVGVLCHELQHQIQKIEGFARGGSVGVLTDIDLTSFRYDELDRQITNILDAHPETAEIYAQYISLRREAQEHDWEPVISDQVNDALEALMTQLGGEELFSLTFDKGLVMANDNLVSAREQYERLAGEVEARNVEKRLSKTEAERKALPPLRTADYAPSDQIVVWNTRGLRSSVIEQLTKPKNLMAIQQSNAAKFSVPEGPAINSEIRLFNPANVRVHSRTELVDGTKEIITATSRAPVVSEAPAFHSKFNKSAGDLLTPRLKRQVGAHESQDMIEALPGVIIPLGFEAAASHVRAAREASAHRQKAWVVELKSRLRQLKNAPDAQKPLVQNSQRALTDAIARQQSLAKLPDPESAHHMSWDSPLAPEAAARLYTTLRLQVAGMTGCDVFAALTRHTGSPQGAATALASAGILGTHTASASVFWDSFTMQLADDLSHLHAQAKLHLAYHGTQHSFDHFNLDRIGTGEGAQAFGYGLYFTESKALAGHYQTQHLENALLYETNRFQGLTDWQDRMIPEIVRQHADQIGDPGNFDIQLRRLSYMSVHQSARLDQALTELPEQQRKVVDKVLEGLMKLPSRYITAFYLMPEGGTRTMKAWADDAYSQQRLGVSLVENALHWRVRPGMNEADLQEALNDLVEEKGDVQFWTRQIDALEEKLRGKPNDAYLKSRLQDATWGMNEAEAVRAAFAQEKFTVCPPIGMGNVYAVEIDIDASDYMRWDKPLSLQSGSVKGAIKSLVSSEGISDACRAALQTCIETDAKGSDVYKALAQRTVTMLANDAVTEAAVSRLLLAHGVQGIRYPEGKTAQQGTARFNYVIFNDSAVHIVGETNKPVREGVDVPLYDYCDIELLENVQVENFRQHQTSSLRM